jgi:hypothetical protein
MAALVEYRWDLIHANETVSVFIYGYADNDAVNYSAVVYGGYAPFDIGHIKITQGETFRHVDGSVARTVYVENLASNFSKVDLLAINESF